MKKNLLLTVFSLALLAELIAIAIGNKEVQYVAKPLIVLSLIIHFMMQRHAVRGNLPYWIILGLGFSWLGDILLLFDTDPDFFLAGLSAFLIAHIFYIIFFNMIRQKEGLRPRAIYIAAVAFYYAALIALLYSRLGDMQLPVIIYGLVISSMFLLALHMKYLKNKEAGLLMVAGATLFVLSDSLLAFNKFYSSFPMAGILIMVTYAGAQYAIMQGANAYLSIKEK